MTTALDTAATLTIKHLVSRYGLTKYTAGDIADEACDELANRDAFATLAITTISDACYQAAYAAGLDS